ncbi:Spindle and kinetochore-associated protein [Ooceraea biroi]|nr:Spindle and kinetochore-associated protein [Ooceraea biroi]
MVSHNILDYTANSSYQFVTRTGQKTPGSVYSNTEKRETIKDCKRTLFNEPNNQICHTIPLITVEEFNKLPKYIIGRQTLDTINSLISAINQMLIAKYTILSLGKAAAQKKGEINLYLQYKKQELCVQEKNEYLYFFTAEDYYAQTKTKLDKTKLNLITALRHCKRLREYKIKNVLPGVFCLVLVTNW